MIKNARTEHYAFLLASVISLVCGNPLASQSAPSISAGSPETSVVNGSSPTHLLKLAAETGRLSPNQKLGRMVLVLASTPEQENAAAALVAAQHDASSPSFHHWLTPAQFGQQFGVSEENASQVKRWLESQGLTVNEVAQGRRFIVFSGNVAQVESAFNTQMHSYTLNGKAFISNSTEIRIPSDLQQVVTGVVRLHSDPKSSQLVLGKKLPFQKKSGQFSFGDGSHYLSPADVATIYNIKPLYAAGIDGTNQKIAIVGRSNIDVQNVRDFRNVFGLPANDPQVIINGDDPGATADEAEAMLDVTWSGAIAPMATIEFVVSQSNFADGVDVSAAYIVDQNLAPVMSTSFGACESDIGHAGNSFYRSLWQQAAAEGITSFVSSGDNGGAGCDAPGAGVYSSGTLAVNGLASTPYNVAVGGTQFDDTANPDAYWSPDTDPTTGESALGYIPETVWNESSNDPSNASLWAGSGGVSGLYAKPAWQVGAGVPADGARDLPDISFTAALHDGYLFCFFSSCSYGDYFYTAGGTSVSSPVAAAIMALVNQKVGGQPQGLANYVFYRLATVPGIFHDTTTGNNKVPDPDGQFTVGYNAAANYDLATGLGSFDVDALVNHWQAAAAAGGTTTTLALGNGQASKVVHGTPISLNTRVICTGGGTCTTPVGSVAFSAAAASAPTLGLGATLLNSQGRANFHAASVPGGNYTITARYGGDGTHGPSSSTPVSVTVTPEASKTLVGSYGANAFTQGPITIEYGIYWQVGIVVAGNSGKGYPTGNLTLTADGNPITTYSYNGDTGTFSPNALTLNYGEKSTLLSSSPSSQASTVSYVVPSQSLGVGTHTFAASYPGDPSFGISHGAYSYNVVQAQSVMFDFFPIGTQVANTPVALAGQLGFSNNGYAPYGGIITISDITDPTPVILGVAPMSDQYGGSYNIPVTEKAVGTRTIRVAFSGDANVKGSYQTYTVPFPATAPSNTSLATDNPNPIAGQPVTLTANVSSDVRLYTATGTVSFLNGSTVIGTAKLDATGNAVLVTTSLPAGPNNLSASYPGDSILEPSLSNTSTDTVADYVLQTLPGSLTIKDGQSASTSINLTPLGGFAQAVSLACSGVPAHTTCTIAKPTVTLDGLHPTTVALTINTSVSTAALSNRDTPWKMPATIALAGLLLLPFRRRKWLRITLSLLLAVSFLAIGCGGSNPNQTPAGTYNVVVTATSVGGAAPKTMNLSIVVTN